MKLTYLSVLALSVVCQVVGSFASAEVSTGKLRVGFIGGFSGPGQIYGIPCRNGFELAREKLPSNFEVFYEDDQFIPSKTVTAFQRLTNVHKIDVLIVLGSVSANAVVHLAGKKEFLFLRGQGIRGSL